MRDDPAVRAREEHLAWRNMVHGEERAAGLGGVVRREDVDGIGKDGSEHIVAVEVDAGRHVGELHDRRELWLCRQHCLVRAEHEGHLP